jgi:hypothetical protein
VVIRLSLVVPSRSVTAYIEVRSNHLHLCIEGNQERRSTVHRSFLRLIDRCRTMSGSEVKDTAKEADNSFLLGSFGEGTMFWMIGSVVRSSRERNEAIEEFL